MKQTGLFFAFFIAGGAVYIGTGDHSAVAVVLFLALAVLALYSHLYPDAPTEDR